MIIVNAWVAYNAVEIEAGGGWQASFVNETDIDALRDCTCSATPHLISLSPYPTSSDSGWMACHQ